MRVPKAIVPFALLLGLGATPLHAQGAEFSLGGGVGFPLSDFDDVAQLGWHGLAAVSVVPTGWPVGIQLDGQYQQFKLDEAVVSRDDLKDRLILGTLNLVYKFKTSEGSTFRPYLIGGGGVYNLKSTGADNIEDVVGTSGSRTKFGINAGAGFDFKAGSAGIFVEGRFHDVFNGLSDASDAQFVPVTVGFRFGGH